MDLSKLVTDGVAAYNVGRDSVNLVNDLVKSFKDLGAEPLYPSLRIKASESKMEFDCGLEIKKKFYSHGKETILDLPTPSKISVFGLMPYQPLKDACEIRNGKIHFNRDVVEKYGGNVKVTMEYLVENSEALSGLVYTSSPRDSKSDENTGDELETYWLHAELKTVRLLREIYTAVRVEDVDVKVEVAVKEHIRELFGENFRQESMMMAKFTSRDRNERARATYYRTHHTPRLKANIFQVINQLQDVLRASSFKKFLAYNGHNFRLTNCEKGLSITDPMEPIYLPNYMNIFSATDLTLDDPAKEGNLIYKKGNFMKKVQKVLSDSVQDSKKHDNIYWKQK